MTSRAASEDGDSGREWGEGERGGGTFSQCSIVEEGGGRIM